MALDKIILVANPGSASRKYSVFKGSKKLLDIHFEYEGKSLVYSTSNSQNARKSNLAHLAFSATLVPDILVKELDVSVVESLSTIALRVVAPSSFFQRDHLLNKSVIKRLERLEQIAPLHIGATLAEYRLLQKVFPKVRFVGVSDSNFLSDKPDKAMYYGLPYKDANQLDIKRFGYHGLSLESVTVQLRASQMLSKRIVVCHLGGGCSVAAIENGRVLDSTMGFSPLEGLVMATRSGSVDMLAYETVKHARRLTSQTLHDYFNSQSGLLGVSGVSSDIRELLEAEDTNPRAKLALDIFVYKIQQAIGSMAASMGGVDSLVFTGTIGERSNEIRHRVTTSLMYLGLIIDVRSNKVFGPNETTKVISKAKNVGKIIVIHTDENSQIAKRASSI